MKKKITEVSAALLRQRAELIRHRLRDLRSLHAERPGNIDEFEYIKALEAGADALDELVAIL